MGRVTLSYVCPHCNSFSLDDYIWQYPRDTGTATTQKEWRAPNRILVVQLGVNANEAKVFKAHATPLRLCDNLINALKLLANQQKNGDSPIQKHCNRPARKKQKRRHRRPSGKEQMS